MKYTININAVHLKIDENILDKTKYIQLVLKHIESLISLTTYDDPFSSLISLISGIEKCIPPKKYV